MTWTLEPSTRRVGPARLTLGLHEPDGRSIAGARVQVEGHMTHAGMRPVIADAVERGPGVYDVPFRFTMAGDWVLLVVATLPDGRRVEQRIDVPGVGPAG